MEIDEIRELFEKHNEEFLEFERVENKLSNKKDLHAFMLLDQLSGYKGGRMVGHAEHDEIYLDVYIEEMELTESIAIDLHRCGVLVDEDTESIKMFV